ncbi:MAG: sigma-70 family RNA polymerase sigma factor [Planctomycetota bacterium]
MSIREGDPAGAPATGDGRPISPEELPEDRAGARIGPDHAGSGETPSPFELVYDNLRRMVASGIRGFRPVDADPTDLVHELYIRISDQNPIAAIDRRHYLNIAARALLQLMIDRQRARQTKKRGGDWTRSALDRVESRCAERSDRAPAEPFDSTRLRDWLTELGRTDDQAHEVFLLRHICGLKNAEVAALLELSEAKVRRLELAARLWLKSKDGRA